MANLSPNCQRLLADGARRAGASIEYGREVVKVDTEQGIVVLTNGKVLEPGLVTGAEGTNQFPILERGSLISRQGYGQRREHPLPVTRIPILSHSQSTTIAR